MNRFHVIIIFLTFALMSYDVWAEDTSQKIPVVVITDLYHPYQDPGDNLDLVVAFGMPGVELKAVLLDISEPFRKKTADHPTLWKDPRGPREGGIIPVEQLNYIFGKNVPYAFGPMGMMSSENDIMQDISGFEQEGINLLLDILRDSREKVEILSFGSARILAVAYNRNPELMKDKVRMIHLSAGMANNSFEPGTDAGANAIPGGEWNVALDVHAFCRLLKSDLPVAVYPCAGKDGGFIKDCNNTYWNLPDMEFTEKMNPQLRRYLDYAFCSKLQYDFLYAMNEDYPTDFSVSNYPKPFHVWESAVWLIATGQSVVRQNDGNYRLVGTCDLKTSDYVVDSGLRPCVFDEIRNDGRFSFSYTSGIPADKWIYFRSDPEEFEDAMREVIPRLYISIDPKNKN